MQRCREERITPGVIVVYTLRADQRPRHPAKEWHGKVIRYYRDFHRAMVVSLSKDMRDVRKTYGLNRL